MADLADQLQIVNAGLKAARAGVTIAQRKDSLVLRATLPSKRPGEKPRQQWVPLGIKASPQGLQAAHRKAQQLAAEKAAGTFDWRIWDAAEPAIAAQPTSTNLRVAEAIQVLERSYWLGRIETAAAHRSWDRLQTELKRLPAGAHFTVDLLVATAAQTEAGSRTRLECCKTFKRLARVNGVADAELAGLDALRTSYEPAQRDVPTDEQLVELLAGIDPAHQYAWVTAALVRYGCRPAEAFSLRPSDDGRVATVLTIKRAGRLPAWRTALALPPQNAPAMPLERSVPWDVTTPQDYCSATAKRRTQAWGSWLVRISGGVQLYDLRHAWALRSIRRNLNASLAAKAMGHSLSVHSSQYHRWITEADVLSAAEAISL